MSIVQTPNSQTVGQPKDLLSLTKNNLDSAANNHVLGSSSYGRNFGKNEYRVKVAPERNKKSNNIENVITTRNVDFTEDSSLVDFYWNRNDLLNKFSLESTDRSSENFYSEDECLWRRIR